MQLQRAVGWSTLSAVSPTLKLILDTLPDRKKMSVLDVGCGEGIYGMILTAVSDLVVDGLDVYRGRVVEHIYNSFYLRSIADFEYERHYDLIVALHVLEHLKKDDAIKVIKTMQENADRLIIGLPNSRKGHVYKDTENKNPHSHKWGVHDFPFEELGLERTHDKLFLYRWLKAS
jgi:SAM-dependent methyltransferase